MVFLDVTEVSYNNGRSRLLNKNQTILEDIEFTSDSDYCDSSVKRNAKKRKSKKRESKKNPKSKKKKNSKSTEKKIVPTDEIINQTSSKAISINESDNSVKKVLTISPLKAENIGSININSITEQTQENKYPIKSINDSTVFNNTSNNDGLLSKKCDSVNKKAHSNVVIIKPLPPTNLEKPHTSSLTSSSAQVKTKYPPEYMTKTYVTQTLLDIRATLNNSNLETIKKDYSEEYVIGGMFLVNFYLQ